MIKVYYNKLKGKKIGGDRMNENVIYEYLKKTSLCDLIELIMLNSKYEKSNDTVEIYYTSNDLYRLYPNIFSKFKLDKYIREDFLPCIKEGRERIFLKSEVDEWLKRRCENEYSEIKRRSDIEYEEVKRKYG